MRDVSLVVNQRSIHCLVGRSGSGKTLTSLAAVGLLPRGATTSGSIRLAGVGDDLLTLDQDGWSGLRGSDIGYVGQNALGCLHPAFPVGSQVVEAIRRHRPIPKAEALQLALEELKAVDLPDPPRVAAARPAQLSGGMCQRVALAIALCNRPALLIADEPTTALDDDTQSHILDLIRARVDRDGLSVLLITHDHSVVDEMADDVTTIVDGVATPAASNPSGPSTPSSPTGPSATANQCEGRDEPDPVEHDEAVLEIVGLGKTFGGRRWPHRDPTPVLHDVTISAPLGTTVGLVGRSGAGKTTLARIVAGILPPTAGSVRIGDRPITGPDRVGRIEKASLVQYVFQDPFGSLNPRRPAVAQVAEPLIAAGTQAEEARQRAVDLLRDVGLQPEQIERRPTKLSGGQCQRVGIARALIRRPLVVVLDEPVSALDWSIRDEILTVLDELQKATGALYLLISHDRALIERQSDRIYQVADRAIVEI